MRTALACMCALAVSAIGGEAQSQSGQQQQQQQQRQQGDSSKPLQNVVTFTGCVYQPSDDPTVYAIRRMEMDQGTSSSSSSSTSSSTNTDRGATTTSSPKPSDRTDGGRAANSSSNDDRMQGAWYRLASNAAQNLKSYVGQRVRVNGQLTPGRDPQGNDIVVHQVTPEKTVVTAIDLKPAPQLSIASITPLGGTCNATSASGPQR